jgi:hypothetical protein
VSRDNFSIVVTFNRSIDWKLDFLPKLTANTTYNGDVNLIAYSLLADSIFSRTIDESSFSKASKQLEKFISKVSTLVVHLEISDSFAYIIHMLYGKIVCVKMLATIIKRKKLDKIELGFARHIFLSISDIEAVQALETMVNLSKELRIIRTKKIPLSKQKQLLQIIGPLKVLDSKFSRASEVLRNEAEVLKCANDGKKKLTALTKDKNRKNQSNKSKFESTTDLIAYPSAKRPSDNIHQVKIDQLNRISQTDRNKRIYTRNSVGQSIQEDNVKNKTRLNVPSLKIFYSYAEKDEPIRIKLEKHLAMLRREKIITDWHFRKISAGTDLDHEIDIHLSSSQIVLLLVSADFLASDYCYDVELKKAMKLHKSGKTRVIPIIVRPCDWHNAPFGKLEALPKSARPVLKWKNQDDAFLSIEIGIRKICYEILSSYFRI